MKLLIVEDNPFVREQTADWFRAKAYEVVSAACAFAARHIMAVTRFDGLIVDIQLPCGQGKTLIEWVLSGSIGNTPLVIWTAQRDDPDGLQGVKIIHKPCNFEELESAILEEVQGGNGRSHTETPR